MTDVPEVHPDLATGPATGSPPAGQSIAGFTITAVGHLLTWIGIALIVSAAAPDVGMILLTAAAALVAAGIAVSAIAWLRSTRGTVGGGTWAVAGVALGILWLVATVAVWVWLANGQWSLF